MKFLQYRYLLITILIVLGLTNLQGCDFITNRPNNDININSEQQKIISKDKKMARLLVEVSEKNYEIIDIVEYVKQTSASDSIKNVAKDLIDDHKILSEAYDRIAKESLISIPEDVEQTELDYIINNESLEPILNRITENLETQLNALNQLEEAVDNEDVANLTFKSKRVLQENLQKMEYVINSI